MVIELVTDSSLNALSDDGHQDVVDIEGNGSDSKNRSHDGNRSAERNSSESTACWSPNLKRSGIKGRHDVLVDDDGTSEEAASDVCEARKKNANQNDDELDWVILEDVGKESSNGGVSRFARDHVHVAGTFGGTWINSRHRNHLLRSETQRGLCRPRSSS